MRNILLVAALGAALCTASGCSLFQSSNATLVSGVEGYANAILPEYERYVDNDLTLDAASKRIRKNSSIGLKKLLEEAKKE
jgi:hypothetical protein